MKSYINQLVLLALTIVFFGCSTKPSSQNESADPNDIEERNTIEDIDRLLEDMPPPSLVPFTLKSIGAAFDDSMINSLGNMERYEVNTDKMALNMGVYASDISYLAAYGEEETCINYLNTSHTMAEQLGESDIYNDKDIDEFRGHIAGQNEEEISKILSKLFLETSMKMEEDHHLTMAGLALAGSFIEGLYHAVITLEKFPETAETETLLEPLVKIVLDEEQALLDIIQVLDDLPLDDVISETKIELKILDRLYKGDLQEVEENLANNPEYVVTKDVMRDITIEVKRIRSAIVE